MRIRKADLQNCLAKAQDIINIYKTDYINGGAIPRSVDTLVDLIARHERKNVEIKLLELTADAQAVRGMYIAYDDRYEVCLLSGQNHCWQRFVLCKELFHVILDNDEYRNMHIGALVEEFTGSFPEIDSRPSPKVTNEKVAEICAMEFLFPYEDRVRLVAGEYNSGELAQRYRLPRVFVERYLSVDYLGNLREFHMKAVA